MARAALTFKATGIKAIQRAYLMLPANLARKVLRQAMRKGMKALAAEARAEAPVESGFMRSKIKVGAAAKRRRGVITMLVKVGAKDFTGKAFYGAMVNYGTKKQEGQHFMERAFESKGQEAVDIIEADILAGILREARG